MATTTLTYETVLADNQGQPSMEGTPSDTKNYSGDYWFWSTGVIDNEGGSWEDQRPALNTNTTPGDLTAPGSGYAWMNVAGFEAAIRGEYGSLADGFGIWLKTKQTSPVALEPYAPTMTALRVYLDVEVRASAWTSTASPSLSAEIAVEGAGRSFTAFGDRQEFAADATTIVTFPLRGLTFVFDQTDGSRDLYKFQTYDPFWDAITSNRIKSLLWPAPHDGGIFEIGWIRLRAEVDFGIEPPRRIYPRDDGLAGGAPRTYPPSRAVQSSNRIVGGYL